ncbi:hypothetical protein KUL118_23930 [Tenacibaculum sp. KUL118]|nr:hypothetical protein KUL118_23930 [Tenacibaculum sp. KUL118]
MSPQLINALKQKSLHIASDITGKFYISGYGGMGMECISPATEDAKIIILSLIEEGKLSQKERVRYSPELNLDLTYYEYEDV